MKPESISSIRENDHSGGEVGIAVSCPVDDDGDFYPDSGGCEDLLTIGFDLRGHDMELYELDGWWKFRRIGLHDDDYVGTLYFPTLDRALSGVRCDLYGCTGGRTGRWRDPKSNSTSKVDAEAALRIRSARFIDPTEQCCDPLNAPGCNQ